MTLSQTLALTLLVGLPLQAGVLTTFSSRAGFGGNDTLDWLQFGPELTFLSSPALATSTGGLGIAAAHAGDLSRYDEGGFWSGHFASGDHLLFTNDSPGSLTLSFASPIFGIGFNAHANVSGGSTTTLEAFGAGDVSFGSFALAGPSGACGGCDDAAFVGLKSSLADITYVVITSTNDGGGFAINQLSLETGGAAAVPEPSTLLSMIGGAGLLALLRLRRRA